ncbi:hypothetical protein CDL12_24150 [Handroanthus impetiginosus]|uniref:non-specific serine/threonine protein kinase n=1 Tax=Handroanthus impetiginosus TaxID=429701 RepID=A0A2G9GDF6_9LAMI|nr:hypothetical protein CDL12_27587 [Handroanthus impetiginosus]PIN03333.1 hypothetical protein CDL12_24150 [Handroanthus impetiginosus]
MNSQSSSLFSFLHLSIIIKLLVLFQSLHGSSNPEEFYHTCGNTFTCGNTITRIGYPFRGSDDPLYCGHPSLVLTCDDRNNVTTIDIMNMTYDVMEIDQATQIMRIVREDVMEGTCPKELVNTTLDHSIFDYASSYMNFTFLYGCSSLHIPDLSLVSCGNGGYDGVSIFPGNLQGPGNCNASVVVPVLVSGNGGGTPVNSTGWDQVLRQGFQITWKIDRENCIGCTESRGRCGYSFETNRTTCFCPDPPFISDTCSIPSGASPATRSGM